MPTVSRRGLFGWITAAAVAPTVLGQRVTAAPGLALKEAGASDAYGTGYIITRDVITEGANPRALWPGVKDWWAKHCAEEMERDYADVFSGELNGQAH